MSAVHIEVVWIPKLLTCLRSLTISSTSSHQEVVLVAMNGLQLIRVS
ncbi:unnamed protein product [Strongylus vulgaris]|uniref:Uncharacterized protein n=1 Tax=Strongylus vulgaris TaxID=40348 RepID=A0A3P7JF99_STRVU|nr:unnamed protein product [Strongylus vulgaris]